MYKTFRSLVMRVNSSACCVPQVVRSLPLLETVEPLRHIFTPWLQQASSTVAQWLHRVRARGTALEGPEFNPA